MRFELAFIYQPVTDLEEAARFYEGVLGLEDAWREGDETRAYRLPAQRTQLMVSPTQQPAGPMYQVDDLSEWLARHPSVAVTIPPYPIPGGMVAGCGTPDGLVFYVFDLAQAETAEASS